MSETGWAIRYRAAATTCGWRRHPGRKRPGGWFSNEDGLNRARGRFSSVGTASCPGSARALYTAVTSRYGSPYFIRMCSRTDRVIRFQRACSSHRARALCLLSRRRTSRRSLRYPSMRPAESAPDSSAACTAKPGSLFRAGNPGTGSQRPWPRRPRTPRSGCRRPPRGVEWDSNACGWPGPRQRVAWLRSPKPTAAGAAKGPRALA